MFRCREGAADGAALGVLSCWDRYSTELGDARSRLLGNIRANTNPQSDEVISVCASNTAAGGATPGTTCSSHTSQGLKNEYDNRNITFTSCPSPLRQRRRHQKVMYLRVVRINSGFRSQAFSLSADAPLCLHLHPLLVGALSITCALVPLWSDQPSECAPSLVPDVFRLRKVISVKASL